MNDTGPSIAELVVGLLGISFLVAQLRSNIERLLDAVFGGLIKVIETVERAVVAALRAFEESVTQLAHELSAFRVGGVTAGPVRSVRERPGESGDDVEDASARTKRRRPVIIDATGPLFYCVAALALLTGDLYLAALRAGPLFGFEVSESLLNPGDVRIDLLAGLLYVVTAVVYAAVFFEAIGVGPRHPPFGTAEGNARVVVVASSGLGLVLSAVLAAMLFVWAHSAAVGEPDEALARQFFALFAPLLVLATALAFVGARESLLALRYLAVLLLKWLAAALGFAANVSADVVRLPQGATVAAVRVVATPGQTFWDWVARTSWGKRAGFKALPDMPSAKPGDVAPPGGADLAA